MTRSTMKCRRHMFAIALGSLLLTAGPKAGVKYQHPPKAILDVFNATVSPTALPSPLGDTLLLATPVLYPPIADLAKPMLRLAGLRIDPAINSEHHALYWSALSLRRVAGGAETRIELPAGARPGTPVWSADGKWLAFTSTTDKGVELWVADAASGHARRLEGVQLNGVFGPQARAFQWMPDQRSLLVRLVPTGRGPAPAAAEAPEGPNVQESLGGRGPSSTYEVRDVLKSPRDEDSFDYYASSQLASVDVTTGSMTWLGNTAVYGTFSLSPDGQYIVVERIHRPYSYLHPHERFPRDVEIWSRTGTIVHQLASLPLSDQVPIQGVPTGVRSYRWLPTEPATLLWAEALDDGNPRKPAAHRDQIRILRAPFTAKPVDVFQTEQRFLTAVGMDSPNRALVEDLDVDKHWIRAFLVDLTLAAPALQLLWESSYQDTYRDPGTPVLRVLPNGSSVVRVDEDWIYLSGPGGTPDGERPFLDRFNLRSRKSERLFRCDQSSFERFVAWVPLAGTSSPAVSRRISLPTTSFAR